MSSWATWILVVHPPIPKIWNSTDLDALFCFVDGLFVFSSQSTTSAHDVVVMFMVCLCCPWPACGASRRPVYTYKSPNTTILCCGARAKNCKTGCRATFGLWRLWVLTDFLKHMLIYLTWLLIRGSCGCRGTEQRCGVDGFLEWLRFKLRLRPLGADFDFDSD